MGRVSERDRNVFRQLLKDCITYDLNENESILYIRKRTGRRKISRSEYYKMKKEISENEEEIAQVRLTEHARIGFALKHFEIMDGIELTLRILFRSLNEESMKPIDKRNLFSLNRIATTILQYAGFLRQLNVDTPFVKRAKVEIDKAKEIQKAASNQTDEDEPVFE